MFQNQDSGDGMWVSGWVKMDYMNLQGGRKWGNGAIAYPLASFMKYIHLGPCEFSRYRS